MQIPVKELCKSRGQVKKKTTKYVKLLVICSEISHTPILHHVSTSQLNSDKIQLTGSSKAWDNRAGDHRTDSSNNINKSEFKWYLNDSKTHENADEKAQLEWVKNSKLFYKRGKL